MQVARLRAGQVGVAKRGPTTHRSEGHVGMKLQAERACPLIRLHREVVALGKQSGATRQLESFAMPVIDLAGPVRAERKARLGRTDRVVADLNETVRMRRDSGAELPCEHLRTE